MDSKILYHDSFAGHRPTGPPAYRPTGLPAHRPTGPPAHRESPGSPPGQSEPVYIVYKHSTNNVHSSQAIHQS